MAHTKAGGKTRQQGNRQGKRLGIKVSGGESVGTGNIITRQRGTTVRAGKGVSTGRDHTLFAIRSGKVHFRNYHGQKIVDVV